MNLSADERYLTEQRSLLSSLHHAQAYQMGGHTRIYLLQLSASDKLPGKLVLAVLSASHPTHANPTVFDELNLLDAMELLCEVSLIAWVI